MLGKERRWQHCSYDFAGGRSEYQMQLEIWRKYLTETK